MAETNSTKVRTGLVALEGDADAISTQLRLLPPSKKILILPSILKKLPQSTEKDVFDARLFVRDVHNMHSDHVQTAKSFLKSSTEAQPRIVLMNGGSVGARTACISRISEAITNGDIGEAEEIFNEIVQDGVAGLVRHAQEAEAEEDSEADDCASESTEGTETLTDTSTEEEHHGTDTSEERDVTLTPKAMQGAQSSDEESVVLQPNFVDSTRHDDVKNNLGTNMLARQMAENFVSKSTRMRSLDHPRPRTLKEKPDLREVGHRTTEGDEIRTTVVTVPNETSVREKRNTFGAEAPIVEAPLMQSNPSSNTPGERNDIYDEGDFNPDLLAPGSDTLALVTNTPDVEYGEACIVDMQSAEPSPVRKTKSVDRFFPSLFNQQSPAGPRVLKQSTSAYPLRSRPLTATCLNDVKDETFQTLPRTTFARASETTIRKSPTTTTKSSASPLFIQSPQVFVDRGTDAGDVPVVRQVHDEEARFSFIPVFETVEDIIINLHPQGSNVIFDTVIASYKEGSYPVLPPINVQEVADVQPEAPLSALPVEPAEEHNPELPRPSSTNNTKFPRRQSYNPFDDDSYPPDIRRQWPPKEKPKDTDSAAPPSEPPAATPLPVSNVSEKLIDIVPVGSGNVISIQNSIRSIMSIHFPTSEGYSQYLYPCSPEVDRLWKPVFRYDEATTIGNEGRTLDQIVAFGSEDGVKKDFTCQISGQIERLGIKKDGLNKSGKLDVRFLISNIMQSFDEIPSDPQDNPLSNPDLLATLLVPQLEAYLAMNRNTRLLVLQYTSEHLAAIFALRTLIGADLINIAGILDTLSSDPPSFASRPRTPTKPHSNPLSNEATSIRAPPRLNSLQTLQRQASRPTILTTKQSEASVSFSKANHLLPSTATDPEIATFLSGIWKTLMEKSPFYAPEPEAKPVIVDKPPPVPKSPTVAAQAREREQRDSGYPPSSFRAPRTERESKMSRLTGNSNASSALPPHKYSPSIASTTRTTNSERGRREDGAWENFYIAEEDSEDDAYDRMILGSGFAKIVPEVRKGPAPKRNTKKALKWLGLA